MASSPHRREREGELIPGLGAPERSMEGLRTPEDAGNEHLRGTGRGWVVQELLEAVRRCLFCGNNFITLI
jgi:general transcription factor 3C polypeptide 4